MKYLFFFALTISVVFLYGQQPNKLTISIKDSLQTSKDCHIHIIIKKRNNQPFLFPKEYKISNDDNPFADIVLYIEKENAKHEYKYFACEGRSVHFDGLSSDTIRYKNFNEIDVLDSLSSLYCFERGKFRIKAMYNKRRNDGKIAPPNYILSSDWHYFYVASNELFLFSRALE